MRDDVLSSSTRVLVVARAAGANRTHPNVVSVPTQRIPPALLEEIVAADDAVGEDSFRKARFFRGVSVDSGDHNGHHPLLYATEALLARKLGLAESLEGERLQFRAGLSARVEGTAVYDNLASRDVYEAISMLNVVVVLTRGQDELPISTSSYSPIAWAAASRFIDAVDSKNPAVMAAGFDPVELCVHGVCLSAARASLTHLLGRRPFASRTDSKDSKQLYSLPPELLANADGYTYPA